MTRKEQIKEYLLTIGNGEMTGIPFDVGFECGVEWADAHPHWISVEDEMPKNRELVLITDCESADMGFYDYIVDAWQPFEKWLGNITHWMPLPAPPMKRRPRK